MTRCPFEEAIRPEHRADPYTFYAAHHGPPTRLEDGRYIVGAYDDVLALLHDPRISSAAAEPEPAAIGKAASILRLDPPEHDRIRRIMMRQFGPPHRSRLVADLEPEIIRTVEALIDAFPANEVEVVETFAHRLPLAIICGLLGIPADDQVKFHDWVAAITAAFGTREPSVDAQCALDAYLAEIAETRRGKPGNDMISGLMNDDGPDGSLSQAAVGPSVALLLIAGHETTVNLIANGVLTLLRQPAEIERLRVEPARAALVIEELLRFEPPVQFIGNRRALADINVSGVTIPKGSIAVLLVAGANRDPRLFPDPDRFDPSRSDNRHLGFGSGIHSCFGAPLARLEAQIALRLFFERVEKPRLLGEPSYRPSPLLRGPSELRVGYSAVGMAP